LFNGKVLGCLDYLNRLEVCGIQSSNSFNFCLQNSIKKLANLPKTGLLDVLSEVIGTKVFDKSRQTVLTLMDKGGSVEQKIVSTLDSIKEKLESLKVDQQQFVEYEDHMKKTHR
jgi:chromosome segregation ATPase